MVKALRTSWKTKAFPEQREKINLSLEFSRQEAEVLEQGCIPTEMDSRWFIYSADEKLYLHRAWTGSCIYIAHLERSADIISIKDVWVNMDREQYLSPGIEKEPEIFENLINSTFFPRKLYPEATRLL